MATATLTLVQISQHNKIELINSKMMQEYKSKNSCTKKNVTNNINVSNDNTNVSHNNITMKSINEKENNKKQLGVSFNCHHGTSD